MKQTFQTIKKEGDLIKKKVYRTYLTQEFNAFVIVDSGKWYKPNKVVEKREKVTSSIFDAYILASNKRDAIEKYKEKYYWDDYKFVIDPFWGDYFGYPRLNVDKPEFKYSVNAVEAHKSFDYLRKEMRADEFLEYCRQEMYPVEVVLNTNK